jgi:hypothetical protein
MSSYISRLTMIQNRTEQSLTYPSEKLVETVGTAVTRMESVMARGAHLGSVEQHITAAIRTALTLNGLGVLAVHFTTKTGFGLVIGFIDHSLYNYS